MYLKKYKYAGANITATTRYIRTQAGMVQSPVTSVLNGYNFTEKVQIKEQDIALNWATFQSNVVAGGFI